MEDRRSSEKTIPELLTRLLLEVVDNNAHLLTVLDLQARILARLEDREQDDIVDEINDLLKARRRSALQDIEEWATGVRTPIADDPPPAES